MNSQPTIIAMLKQLGLFAILGFAVVILAGPIIGALSVLLSIGAVVLVFATVGFLGWALVQAMLNGPQAAVDRLQDAKLKGQAMLNTYGGNMKTAITWPVQAITTLAGSLLLITVFLVRSVWTSFWFVTEVGIVAAAGTLVGGIVGWWMAQPMQVEATTIAYAAIGGLLAAVTGVLLTWRERQATRNRWAARYRFDSTAAPQA